MPSHLPQIPHSPDDDVSRYDRLRSSRDRRRAILAVERHSIEMAAEREMALIDIVVIEDVVVEATESDLRFLEENRARADASEVARTIIASYLQQKNGLNTTMIRRRFGP